MSPAGGGPTLLIGEPGAVKREREGELRVAATAPAEERSPRLGSFLASKSCGSECLRGVRISRGGGGGGGGGFELDRNGGDSFRFASPPFRPHDLQGFHPAERNPEFLERRGDENPQDQDDTPEGPEAEDAWAEEWADGVDAGAVGGRENSGEVGEAGQDLAAVHRNTISNDSSGNGGRLTRKPGRWGEGRWGVADGGSSPRAPPMPSAGSGRDGAWGSRHGDRGAPGPTPGADARSGVPSQGQPAGARGGQEQAGWDGAVRDGESYGRELLQRIEREERLPRSGRRRRFDQIGVGVGVGVGARGDVGVGRGDGVVQLPLASLSPASNHVVVDPPLPPALSYQHPPVELARPPEIMMICGDKPPPGREQWSQQQQQQQVDSSTTMQQGQVFSGDQAVVGAKTIAEAPPPAPVAPTSAAAAAAATTSPLQATQNPPQPQYPAPETTTEPTIEERRAASEALWQQVFVSRTQTSQPSSASSPSQAQVPAPAKPADVAAAQPAAPAPASSFHPSVPPKPSSPISSAAVSSPDNHSPRPPIADAREAAGSGGEATAGEQRVAAGAGAGALQKRRSALRNWRSASYNYALVLVGAARLPRKTLAAAAKMPGAVWVDRHELGEPCSLPLEVKTVLAKSLAAQMPSCASCDDNEAGRGKFFFLNEDQLESAVPLVECFFFLC